MRMRILVLLLPSLVVASAFAFAGDLLDINQAPVPSNAIIVLGGGPPARVERAVALYDEGYGHYLIMSGGAVYNPWQTQAEHMRQQAVRLGVPERRILLENRSLTTYQNALYCLDVMRHHGMRSAIVVSSDFHMRRAWMDFSYVFAGSGIRLTFCSSRFKGFRPGLWWSTAVGWRLTIGEYAKMAYTIVVDFMLRRGQTTPTVG